MGFFHTIQDKRGFTLVEVLVAVGIILILASVVFFNAGGVKKNSRDKQRVSDIHQVELAARAYQDHVSAATLPIASTAEIIGDGVGFDTTIAPYVTDTIQDPLHAGVNQYYYRTGYSCAGTHTIIVALNMEIPSNGNFASVCGPGPYSNLAPGVTPTAASYVIILQ